MKNKKRVLITSITSVVFLLTLISVNSLHSYSNYFLLANVILNNQLGHYLGSATRSSFFHSMEKIECKNLRISQFLQNAYLSIEELGVHEKIHIGTEAELEKGVWLWPENVKKIVLLVHRFNIGTRASPFKNLSNIDVGSIINLKLGIGRNCKYEISEIYEVHETKVEVLTDNYMSARNLTIVTCKHFDDSVRVIIEAKLVDDILVYDSNAATI